MAHDYYVAHRRSNLPAQAAIYHELLIQRELFEIQSWFALHLVNLLLHLACRYLLSTTQLYFNCFERAVVISVDLPNFNSPKMYHHMLSNGDGKHKVKPMETQKCFFDNPANFIRVVWVWVGVKQSLLWL